MVLRTSGRDFPPRHVRLRPKMHRRRRRLLDDRVQKRLQLRMRLRMVLLVTHLLLLHLHQATAARVRSPADGREAVVHDQGLGAGRVLGVVAMLEHVDEIRRAPQITISPETAFTSVRRTLHNPQITNPRTGSHTRISRTIFFFFLAHTNTSA